MDETVTLIELQTSNTGSVGVIANVQRTVRDQDTTMAALSLFHQKCSLAAITACDVHVVMMVDHLGQIWRGCYQAFYHGQADE